MQKAPNSLSAQARKFGYKKVPVSLMNQDLIGEDYRLIVQTLDGIQIGLGHYGFEVSRPWILYQVEAIHRATPMDNRLNKKEPEHIAFQSAEKFGKIITNHQNWTLGELLHKIHKALTTLGDEFRGEIGVRARAANTTISKLNK